ncbi:SRPBCC domain-containing protein [Gryllotalpicola protaetiae]|uniref:Polyketide cyclase n=1 Tax=Gryllotalpicola protaetiae TaxID=2419771 RepID=A0A387BG08_9MICO|nr:SRPBCC domain-containing protein [Gryllotalpicola protaetiae]AYG02863.1 polyketide cyclase [Gryllotalpicola protaetiae]
MPTTFGSFAIERTVPASPARVFACFADDTEKRAWFTGPDGFVEKAPRTFDFRVGGDEFNSVGTPDGPAHVFRAHYYDIVENERIVYAYEMYDGETRSSVSVATIEIAPVGDETKLTITESGVFFGDPAEADGRRHGTILLVNVIVAYLAGELVR